MKFHLIQPMGGGGTRFLSSQVMPKPLISLQDKPFFYWATKSLSQNNFIQDITYVILKQHIDKFNLDKHILKYFPNANIVELPQVLNGAVLTCLEGVKHIDDDLPIIFNDCDHAFKCVDFFNFLEEQPSDVYGGLLTFSSNEPKFSYVIYDNNGQVIGTIEKKVVSNDAICGAYYFKNKKVFVEYAERYLKNCNYSEYFMSGIYNELCKDNKKVTTFKTNLHLSFGTPEEYLSIKDSELFGDINNGNNRQV